MTESSASHLPLEHKTSSSQKPDAMILLLLAGIVLRFVVLLTASPFNPDAHLEVIQYLVENGSLAKSNILSQSYHPPLYYLLMAGLWKITASFGWNIDAIVRSIHFASFVFSSANLWLIHRGLQRYQLIGDRQMKWIAFSLACFLPQFVMFGSFISNDPLTLLIGTLILLAAVRYIEQASTSRLVQLSSCVGIGLLTKGTFILTGPALAILVGLVESRKAQRQAMMSTAGFCAIFAIIGCYKYVDNYATFGTFIIHNLDRGGDVFSTHQNVWRGPQTLFDINIFKLIRRPILQIHNAFSYPLLMYATFWYSHIPDSSYRAAIYGYAWVGSILYGIAVVPTILFFCGVWRAIVGCARNIGQNLIPFAAMLLLGSNLAVVLAAGIKYDVWWCFQSRLCFQSMLPAMLLFGLAGNWMPQSAIARRIILAICWMTVGCCVLYFAVEIAFAGGFLPAGAELQP